MPHSPQTPSRRHHTVPAFYLRGFANGNKIRVIELPGVRGFVQPVGDASVETDFYSIPGHPDGDDVMESALADVEAETAPVIQRITEGGWPLSVAERARLSWYLALQGTRAPVQRRTLDAIYAQTTRLQIGLAGRDAFQRQMEAGGAAGLDEDFDRLWQEAVRPEGPPLNMDQVEFLEEMVNLAQRILPTIAARPWSFHIFDRHAIITSDSPVTLVASTDASPHRGVGYGTAENIFMPISRRVALILGELADASDGSTATDVANGRHDARYVGTTKIEKLVNSWTAHNASRWIYLHPDDERFVPEPLPDPKPVSMEMSSSAWEFDGAPGGGADLEADDSAI